MIDLLACPVTHEPLRQEGTALVSVSGRRYPLAPSGIPLFAAQPDSTDAKRQQAHYDRVAAQYIENLGYPHTEEYSRYLDAVLFSVLGEGSLGDAAEICCGRGEAVRLLGPRMRRAVGVDISLAMLEGAQAELRRDNLALVQGDATALPLRSAAFDHVLMLGGIHHVNDRAALFREVHRILKPGGRFVYREPVSDFFLWRWLRAVIYRVSPALDAETERPLRLSETVPVLEQAGLRSLAWRTCGFLGGAVLLNSDVLVFNRAFRFLPGIRPLTRAAARVDDWTLRLPGLAHAGLQVVGLAEKPQAVA